MKKFAFVFLALTAACGDDGGANNECGAGTTAVDGECVADVACGSGTTASNGECVADVTCGPDTIVMNGVCVPTVPSTDYVQVEHLARPGIAEALLISDGFLAGYNATAPTFAGVPTADLNAVVGEAKTVLKAIYLGVCFVNGAAGLTAATGLKPAGIQCHAVGAAVFEANGETHTAASITNSQAYADAVFAYFIQDVMRIDTTAASGYLTPCAGNLQSPQLLCGGRNLRDDVIDITYDFLLNGAGTCTTAAACQVANQFTALVSDGVAYQTDDIGGGGNTSRIPGNAANPHQGKDEPTGTFPYAPAPI